MGDSRRRAVTARLLVGRKMPTPGASNSERIVMTLQRVRLPALNRNAISMLGNAQRGLADDPADLVKAPRGYIEDIRQRTSECEQLRQLPQESSKVSQGRHLPKVHGARIWRFGMFAASP
jgi:hypothetical protein